MEARAQKILAAIVDEYIRTGEPVGSKALVEKLDISVSSATIRNEMAQLESEGYLEHPHTSAGRMPTYKGYRYYIDHLMAPEPLNEEDRNAIDSLFESEAITDEAIVQNASTALAEITKCATFSMNHASQFSAITKVDVIPTGRRMYVLLLITSNGDIRNRVCRMEFDLSDEQMEFFTGFINSNLKGVNLSNLSEDYVDKLAQAMGSYMMALSPLLYAVYELSEDMMKDSIEVKGETNLLTSTEFPITDVMKFLEQKNELSTLLDSSFSGISIRFGSEEGTFAISNSTFVSASYYKDGVPAGAIGVIGPMRLDYRKIIPYIEYFSNKVTRLLSEEEEKKQLTDIEREVDDDGS